MRRPWRCTKAEATHAEQKVVIGMSNEPASCSSVKSSPPMYVWSSRCTLPSGESSTITATSCVRNGWLMHACSAHRAAMSVVHSVC